MKLVRIQILFFLSLCFLYLGGSAAVWWLQMSRERDRQLNLFQSVLENREGYLKDLIPAEQEEFPNYEKKLVLVKALLMPWIGEVSSVLTNPSSDWKKKLAQLGLPFQDAAGLFVGRGSRVIYQRGRDFEEILGEGWAKDTFLAIRGGEKTFLKRQRLYFMPISYEELEDSRNTFQTIFYFGKYLFRYYRVDGPYRMFLILDLKKISYIHLERQVQNHLLNTHPSLGLSRGDLFDFNGNQLFLSDSPKGFSWRANFQGFLTFMSGRYFWNLGFILLLIYLVYLGGFKIFYLRFEVKVFVRYALFLGFLFLCFQYVRTDLYEGQVLLDSRKAEESWEEAVKQLDNGFNQFLERLGARVRNSFASKEPLQGNPLYKAGLYGMDFDPRSGAVLSDDHMDAFSLAYLLRLTKSFASTHKHFQGGLSEEEMLLPPTEEMYEANMHRVDQVTVQYGLNSLRERVPRWIRDATEGDQSYWKNVYDEGKRLKELNGNWLAHQVLMSKHYFMGLLENTQLGPRFLGTSISSGDAFLKFLKEGAIKHESQFGTLSFLVLSPTGELFTFPRDNRWDRGFFEELWTHARLSAEGVTQVNVGQESYLGTFFRSETVNSFRYLILQKEDEIFQESNALRVLFDRFQTWYWILGILFGLFLGRITVRPLELLREGFQKLKAKNFDFQLFLGGKNENARMIQVFNDMVGELAQKERMMPYVNAALETLLDDQGHESQDEKFIGPAVVVVSDIRSFTTLSAQYPPEEVVQMLGEYFGFWQERVERNQGIIERFIGDAVVALFFEKNSPHFVQQALQCSLEVQQDLQLWNQKRQSQGEFPVENGIGMSMGEIAFDLVGTRERMEFLSLGIPVERATILETKTRDGSCTRIYVDEEIQLRLKGLYDFEQRSGDDHESPFYEVIDGSFSNS